jgi:hypothetical protein
MGKLYKLAFLVAASLLFLAPLQLHAHQLSTAHLDIVQKTKSLHTGSLAVSFNDLESNKR